MVPFSAPSRPRRTARALACALVLLAGALLRPALGAGVEGAPTLPPGVPPADLARIEKVLANATVSTRVEVAPYPLRLDVFDYLLDHPEFATQVTRALKLARYRIWRTADGLNLDEGWGVTGLITPFYGDGGLRVVYARGRYEQSVLPDISGQVVILLRYADGPGPNGRPALATSMEVFAQLDSAMVATFAGSIAKSKATSEGLHVLKVFSRLSRHLERRADEVLAELGKNPDVSRANLEGFRRVLKP
ncbi:MAG: hypothetical protein HYR50_11600 [Candidatus Rokubacteria bacterium]|nr:hypothetical protein [Candidatus Rokubacteria bacterium]